MSNMISFNFFFQIMFKQFIIIFINIYRKNSFSLYILTQIIICLILSLFSYTLNSYKNLNLLSLNNKIKIIEINNLLKIIFLYRIKTNDKKRWKTKTTKI